MAGARAAKPLLASSLVGEEEVGDVVKRMFARGSELGGVKKRSKEEEGKRLGLLSSGIKSVDEMLAGGLRTGSVVCMSGDLGVAGGAFDLSLHFAASSLFAKPDSMAAVIDTTGNLDIFRLFTIILDRLRVNSELRRPLFGALSLESVTLEELAAKALERVKIMRVFDLVGLLEAVDEIRGNLEGRLRKGKGVSLEYERDENRMKGNEKNGEIKIVPEEPRVLQIPDDREKDGKEVERVIQDSQESEDEMLFESSAAELLPEPVEPVEVEPAGQTLPIAQLEAPQSAPSMSTHTQQLSHEPEAEVPDEKDHHEDCELQPMFSFILVDSLAHLVNPLLSKDYVQGHTLSHALLHSLATLTHSHNLHTLLLNPTTPPRTSKDRSPTRPSTTHPSDDSKSSNHPILDDRNDNWFTPPSSRPQAQVPPPSPSIFSENHKIPALGSIMPMWLDVHLLVSEIPKRREDARALAGNLGAEVGKSVVVEVVKERWGGRVGDWGVLGA